MSTGVLKRRRKIHVCLRNAPSLLHRHKLFLSVGHDEYWSGQQRQNVESARDSGLSLAFFSGNEVFWRTRWEDDFRTLVVYKESQERVKKDPDCSILVVG